MERGQRARKAGKKDGKLVKTQAAAETAKRREALKESLRQKLQLEQKALRVVERLLEDDVTDDFLIDCARFITPANYKDAVEERSIAKMCGYPICPSKLDNVPKQQFKISTKTNKVYDITERKCFCSNFCYRASKYFASQISKTPLWLRGDERPPDVKLLEKGESGKSGEEVKLAHQPVTEADIEDSRGEMAPPTDSSESGAESSDSEQEFVSSVLSRGHPGPKETHPSAWNAVGYRSAGRKRVTFSDTPHACGVQVDAGEHSGGAGELEAPPTRGEERHTQQPVEGTSSFGDHSGWLKESWAAPHMRGHSTQQLTDNTPPSANTEEGSLGITQVGMSRKGAAGLRGLLGLGSARRAQGEALSMKTTVLGVLRCTLTEWRTEDTLSFLYGPGHAWHAEEEQEEEELDEDDLEENMEIPARPSRRPTAAVPDMESLRKETELLNLRVREFYRGVYVLPEEVDQAADPEEPGTGSTTSHKPVLPLPQSRAQCSIQKHIVMEKLSRSLRDIVGPLGLTMNDVMTDLNNLVRTFRFTSSNIIHKSPEWILIAVVLLLALTEVSPVIRESLASPSSAKYVSTLMREMALEEQDLHGLVQLFRRSDSSSVSSRHV